MNNPGAKELLNLRFFAGLGKHGVFVPTEGNTEFSYNPIRRGLGQALEQLRTVLGRPTTPVRVIIEAKGWNLRQKIRRHLI